MSRAEAGGKGGDGGGSGEVLLALGKRAASGEGPEVGEVGGGGERGEGGGRRASRGAIDGGSGAEGIWPFGD